MHNFNTSNKKSAQRGFSLIELLISLGLGVIIIAGTGQAMLAMSASSKIQTQKNEMEKTANIAFAYLGQHLRGALATPCEKFNLLDDKGKFKISPLTGADSPITDAVMATKISNLIKHNGFNIESGDVNVGGQALKSDSIIFVTGQRALKLAGETGIKGSAAGGTWEIEVEGEDLKKAALRTDDVLFAISDCQNADVFSGRASVDNKVDVTLLDGSTVETKGMAITPIVGTEFSVNYRGADLASLSAIRVPKVYVKNGQLTEQPYQGGAEKALLDNIDAIRVLFGVDSQGSDGSIDKYLNASDLSDDDDIISAEVYLLVSASQSLDNAGESRDITVKFPSEVSMSGLGAGVPMQDVTFNDNRLRRVFTRSITLRNNAGI